MFFYEIHIFITTGYTHVVGHLDKVNQNEGQFKKKLTLCL